MPLTDKYVFAARTMLEEIARNRANPIFYSDLTDRLHIATQAAGGVLIPISDESYKARGVLLSVLVVGKESGMPSDRFFDQARKLGAMKPGELPQLFFRAELSRVYDAYAAGS